TPETTPYEPSLRILLHVLRVSTIACLVAYVLVRQGRRLTELGLAVSARDLAPGLVLAALGLLPFVVRGLLLYGVPGRWLTSGLTTRSLTLKAAVGALILAALGELILRPYVMTEALVSGRRLWSIGSGVALGLAVYPTDRLNLVFSVLSEA